LSFCDIRLRVLDVPLARALITPGWPSWVRTSAREPVPFAPEHGLLVQNRNRVWWQASSEEPFVPLFFHQKFATLRAGSAVEIRQTGEFVVLLHTSTGIKAWGPTELRVERLDETSVQLAVTRLTKLRLTASLRQHDVTLPDGSRLHVAAVEPGAVGGEALLEIVRYDEPRYYSGRATMTNLGRRDVEWRHALGTTTLAPGRRVTFFLTPPAAPTAMSLDPGDAGVQRSGGDVVVATRSDSEITWCGARFQLPAGAKLTLESLAGDGFAEPAAKSVADGSGR
jgi:hypothetical protein